jgi:hypothetical protein
VYDATNFIKMAGDYVVRTDGEGRRVMYESPVAAAALLGINVPMIRKSIVDGLPHLGGTWSIAAADEYENYVPVTPGVTAPARARHA